MPEKVRALIILAFGILRLALGVGQNGQVARRLSVVAFLPIMKSWLTAAVTPVVQLITLVAAAVRPRPLVVITVLFSPRLRTKLDVRLEKPFFVETTQITAFGVLSAVTAYPAGTVPAYVPTAKPRGGTPFSSFLIKVVGTGVSPL